MLNTLWPLFIIISFIYAICSGNIASLNNSIFDSCKSAVELAITFFGSITLWCGIMQIARDSSLSSKLSKFLSPIISFLFPEVKHDKEISDNISLNIISNILGFGNASTPLGIKSMQNLQVKNPNKDTLSNPMIMLILLNTASLQLIPTTVIALRHSLNSNNPSSIILPVWLSTICAAFAGILSVKLFIKLGK